MSLFTRRPTLLAGVLLTALTGGVIGLSAGVASAAPSSVTTSSATTATRAVHAHTATDANTDSSLSALSVTGGSLTDLAPQFDPATHNYEVVGNDDSPATVTPTFDAVGETATVTSANTSYPLVSGSATVPLTRGENDITVTVTSADSSQTSSYVVSAWRLAAPTSQIVSLANATSSVLGGALMTVTLTHGQMPDGCSTNFAIGGQPTYLISATFDPATGLTKDVVPITEQATRTPGTADLTLTNTCNLIGGGQVQATTTAPDAVTYTAGITVSSADIPSTVTSGTPITVHGPSITPFFTDLDYWITKPTSSGAALSHDGGEQNPNLLELGPSVFAGSAGATMVVGYAYGNPFFAGSGQRTFNVGYCPQDSPISSACTTVYSQTINWVAPVPTNVSFSPSNGPQAGGTVITLKGQFLVSGATNPTITVGGQNVPSSSWNVVNEADESEDFDGFTQGQDIIKFPAPPATKTGPVTITATNDYGSTVARGTFTYSATPTITAITPDTVANSGGSVVTVTGTNFGTAGTPTVIIDGVKSPSVTRVSATKLTAVVPADTAKTSAVNLSVSSPQGGGISLPSSLNLVAPTTLPTVTAISPASGHASDDVTLTGTGFGPAGTVGVSIDGQWAQVTASTATSISFEVPATNTPGAKDLVVGATTGAVTKSNAFTVLPDDGINAVSPATVPSYATGNTATVTLSGSGFGTTGTVKVGSATAVAYAATAGGTQIANVAVPTTSAGLLSIIVTPSGSSNPLRANVSVTGPSLSYVGPDPFNNLYATPDYESFSGGEIFYAPTTGGTAMRIEGAGFGTSGTLTFGSTTVTTTSWTDGVITFNAPAHSAGPISVTVSPAGSTLAASRASAFDYVAPAVGVPAIGRIASVVDYSHNDRSDFDPTGDATNTFTITGANLAGTDDTDTTVVLSDGTQTFTVTPTSVTDSSLTFAAPLNFTNGGWKQVEVDTNVGTDEVSHGMYYLTAGVEVTVSPDSGLCLRSDTPATGSVTYSPADVTIANTSTLFGDAGTVSIDGDTITPTSYADNQIVISMANLTTELAQPWGGKSIVITPDDTSLAPTTVGFDCAVTPSVTTTVNSSTNDLTVAAGTAYTLGYTTTGFVGSSPFSATAPTDYEYVSASDYALTGFNDNVHAGAPVGAGDYYVRVALSRSTYANDDYLFFQPSPVHITITGTPITITPVSTNGASFGYKGQLGDGTNGSSSDFSYTAGSTPDPITGVTWEYRDSVCESQDANAGWRDGLPKDVALSDQNCGGDGVTRSKWDVRVASFTMNASGTDRSIYYQATEPTTQITITPRNLTVTTPRADKVYDGTTTATVGTPTFTGEIDGDDVSLANTSSSATFASATPGVNKAVTLSAPLSLTGGNATDYTLTNPQPTIVGTITKASAVLSLAESTSSVLLSQNTPVTITPTVLDGATNNPVDNTASPVVLTSQTPTICTISGTTVTAHAAGVCTIAGTEAASADYTAATAASDPTSTTETIDIHVFPTPQAISVIADDFTAAVGDSLDPTSQISGLFDGDTVDGVDYDYYSGSTLLTNPPTDPGTYKVVPKGGTLTAANTAVYSNPTAFTYVAGTLTITPVPPTITSVAPASGPVTGGTTVTITGTLLDTVKSVRIGGITLRLGSFTVSSDGTTLSFVTPAAAAGPVDLTLVAGTATADDSYTYVANPPGAPTHVTVVGHDGSIAVTFTPPTSDGGAPITSYQISTDGGTTWKTVTTTAGAGGTLTATVSGLPNGVAVSVEVRAINSRSAGAGTTPKTATPVAPISTPSRPGAPTHLVTTALNDKIGVTFTPPAAKAGVVITSYQISTNGGRTWHTVATKPGAHGTRTATVKGLKNGVKYDVLVRAVDSHGAGPAAAKVSVVIPNAPALGTVRHAPSSEVAIPKKPKNYHGPRLYTKALNTSHNGTWAHPIPDLGKRQLTVGEAATLSKSSLFGFNSPVLTAAGHAAVKNLAGHLRLAHAVSCEGYTDYAGAAHHEKTLSGQRAVAVCQALKHYGAHVKTVTHGYGGARPVVIGGSPRSRAANRRVVVLVTA
jgi:outer membrane protein OmpA-like peptidoglycan-associated protein